MIVNNDSFEGLTEEDLMEFIRAFCDTLNIGYNEIIQKNKGKTYISDRRMILGYLLNVRVGLSLEFSGKLISRDHSSISHYKKAIPNLLDTDLVLRGVYEKAVSLLDSFINIEKRERSLTNQLMESNRKLREKLLDRSHEISVLNGKMNKLIDEVKSYKIRELLGSECQ